MSDSPTFGRRAVILAVLVAVAAMFVTSFVYRLNHPNLFVKAQMAGPAEDDHGDEPQGGNPAMSGAMSMVKEYMDRVEKDPNDAEALVGLGNAFLMMRAWDRALEPLGRALQLRPDDTAILKGIGIAHFNKEDYEAATASYEAILKVDPNDTLALFNLGVIYKHYFKKPEVAGTYFEKVLALEKEDAEMIKLARQELGK